MAAGRPGTMFLLLTTLLGVSELHHAHRSTIPLWRAILGRSLDGAVMDEHGQSLKDATVWLIDLSTVGRRQLTFEFQAYLSTRPTCGLRHLS